MSVAYVNAAVQNGGMSGWTVAGVVSPSVEGWHAQTLETSSAVRQYYCVHFNRMTHPADLQRLSSSAVRQDTVQIFPTIAPAARPPPVVVKNVTVAIYPRMIPKRCLLG